MDVVIHNAEEAAKACLPHLKWVTDAVAADITDFDTPIYTPPDHLIARIIDETIYKITEVPCGWAVFHGFGIPNFAKRMRETGNPGDGPQPVGGGPLLINRWTGEAETVSSFDFPTWNAAVQNYIYHLPKDQRDVCRQPEFSSRWKPDPIRFWPPQLTGIGVGKIRDLEKIRFALERVMHLAGRFVVWTFLHAVKPIPAMFPMTNGLLLCPI